MILNVDQNCAAFKSEIPFSNNFPELANKRSVPKIINTLQKMNKFWENIWLQNYLIFAEKENNFPVFCCFMKYKIWHATYYRVLNALYQYTTSIYSCQKARSKSNKPFSWHGRWSVEKKTAYFITFLVAKNEVLVGGHENFVEELERAFGVLKSSVVRDFKCGLQLCCVHKHNDVLKQFPRTSVQTVSTKKNKDPSKKMNTI